MNTYAYRGYVITETEAGYFIVHGYEFFSYDEACDWIDDQLDGVPSQLYPSPVPELHTYHIFYVTKSYDRGYDEYIYDYTPEQAIKQLKRMHKDIAYIADCYEID